MNDTNYDEEVHVTENDLPQEFILKILGQHEAKGMWGIKNTREPVDSLVKYAKSRELSLPLVQVIITKEGIFVNPIASRFQCQIQEGEPNRSGERENITRHRVYGDKEPPPPSGCKVNEKLTSNYWESEPRYRTSSANPSRDVKKENGADDRAKSKSKFHFCFGGKREEKKMTEKTITDLRILEKFSRFDWRKAGILFFGIDTISYGVQDLIFTRVFSMIVVLDRRTRLEIGSNSSFMCHAFVCESRNTARRVTYALAAAFQAYGRAVRNLAEKTIPRKKLSEAKPKKIVIELIPQHELGFDVSEA